MRRPSFPAAAAKVTRLAEQPLATALIFITLSVTVYWRILDGWFLSDDCTLSFVVPDGENVAWQHVLRVFASDWVDRGDWAAVRYYRPIVIVTQALDALLWGANPAGFHLTNVVLHGTNGFLLHRLARSVGATPATSWFAAVLFVVFPWNGESVAWISGRTDVLCATFQLATLLLYVTSRSAPTARRRVSLLVASLATFALALGSKEPAIALPALICAGDVLLESRERHRWRRFLHPAAAWLAFASVALGYLWIRKQALGTVWGGGEMTFFPERSAWLDRITRNGKDNLALLLMPYNRVALAGSEAVAYWSYVVGYAALALGALDSVRRGAVPVRPILLSLVWTVASAAPFILGAHVELDLQSARFLYFTTACACLLLGSVAAAVPRAPSCVAAVLFLGISTATLSANLGPWIQSGETMRRVTTTYGRAFGWYEGELIEKLPLRHQGAYIGLFNAGCMSRPFVLEPPRRDAAARYRAVYDAKQRDLQVLPDPVFGSVERLDHDQQQADWLFPLDGSALDEAWLQGIDRLGRKEDVRVFHVRSPVSWIVLKANDGSALPTTATSEEQVYLLMRPAPPRPPRIFWVTRPGEQFGDPRLMNLRPELAVIGDALVARERDGFVVYSAPLPRGDETSWPGIERVHLVRIDPSLDGGPLEIAFFGIARREVGSASR